MGKCSKCGAVWDCDCKECNNPKTECMECTAQRLYSEKKVIEDGGKSSKH